MFRLRGGGTQPSPLGASFYFRNTFTFRYFSEPQPKLQPQKVPWCVPSGACDAKTSARIYLPLPFIDGYTQKSAPRVCVVGKAEAPLACAMAMIKVDGMSREQG